MVKVIFDRVGKPTSSSVCVIIFIKLFQILGHRPVTVTAILMNIIAKSKIKQHKKIKSSGIVLAQYCSSNFVFQRVDAN